MSVQYDKSVSLENKLQQAQELSRKFTKSLAIQSLRPRAWEGCAKVETWWVGPAKYHPSEVRRTLANFTFNVRGGPMNTIENWPGDQVPEILVPESIKSQIRPRR